MADWLKIIIGNFKIIFQMPVNGIKIYFTIWSI